MKPDLSRNLSAAEFNTWYWLKAELQKFCRANELSTAGSKEALLQRVRGFLAGDPSCTMPVRRKTRAPMPDTLRPQTVIGTGWTLGQPLRQFFLEHAGPRFAFNQVLRDIFKEPQGRTLQQALDLYRESRSAPSTPIGRQFQFNQHIREYFAAHPDGTREEALKLWQARKNMPGNLKHTDLPEEDGPPRGCAVCAEPPDSAPFCPVLNETSAMARSHTE